METDGGAIDVQFSPDGKMIVTKDRRGLQLWNYDTGERIQRIPAGVCDIAFAPDSARLATLGGNAFRIWDIHHTQMTDHLTRDESELKSRCCAAWSPDNTHVILGGFTAYGSAGDVEIWDTRTHAWELLLDDDGQPQTASALDWSADDLLLAVATCEGHPQQLRAGEPWSGLVRIFDARSRRLVEAVHEDETRCQELRFTPDGKRLITRHDSGKLLRWDTSAWKATTIIDSNTLRAFAISPDNRELAVGLQVEPQESRVDFYDMTSGELLRSHAVPNLRNGALRASRQPAVLS